MNKNWYHFIQDLIIIVTAMNQIIFSWSGLKTILCIVNKMVFNRMGNQKFHDTTLLKSEG